MEITSKGSGINAEAYIGSVNDKGPVEPVQGAAAPRRVQEDKVVLSPEAREIQDAKRRLETIPDIRTEKVDEIRRQLESGTYSVKGDRVAVKMISESLINELL